MAQAATGTIQIPTGAAQPATDTTQAPTGTAQPATDTTQAPTGTAQPATGTTHVATSAAQAAGTAQFGTGTTQAGYAGGSHARELTGHGALQFGGIPAANQNYGASSGWAEPMGAVGSAPGDFWIEPRLMDPPRTAGGRAWLGIGVAATVLVAGAVAVVVAGGTDEASADGTPSMVSALTTSAGTRAPARRQAAQPGPPVVPGYQVVVVPDSAAAYDVPADWTVGDPGASGGFGKPPNTVGGKGYATEGKNYCQGSTRTVAFVTGSDNTDTVGAATELGTKTAKIAYSNSPGGGIPGAPQPLESLDGAQHGTFVETRGAITDAKPGCATEYSVYTFATSADIGSFVMVIAADTGVPNAVDSESAKRIFRSVRSFES
ncbi:hypothetical protein [Nocardia xishanensis]|uniref:hypothetical protein n=1 Tax=Nocardia xishanensis TaxID=238964 RepID=UPI000835D725|nr:hypothetical protein [Nocardia xishanensis]